MANEVKACRDCKLELPLASFGKHAAMKDGLRSYCKRCSSLRSVKWNAANPERVLDTRLRRVYGITLERYLALLVEQNGVCAVCGEVPAFSPGRLTYYKTAAPVLGLVVDHDHETGQVRGLLCNPCNTGIGMLRDSAAVIRSAAKYLEEGGRHRE